MTHKICVLILASSFIAARKVFHRSVLLSRESQLVFLAAIEADSEKKLEAVLPLAIDANLI